jgi:hypothetical protein
MIKNSRNLITLGILVVLLSTNISTVISTSWDGIKAIYDIPDDAEILHYDPYYVIFATTDYVNCTVTLIVIILIPDTLVHVGGDICDSYCEYLLDSSSSHVITFWVEYPDGNIGNQFTIPIIFPDCTAPSLYIYYPRNELYINDKSILRLDLDNPVCIGPITISVDVYDTGDVQIVLFELSNGDTHYDTTFPYEFYYNMHYFGWITVNVTAIDYALLEGYHSMTFFKLF